MDRPVTETHPATPAPELVSPRAASVVLAVGGLLFAVYPALRPYTDETSPAGAAAFASSAWALSHLCAIALFVLLPLGLLGVRAVAGPARRTAGAAVLTAWIGAGAVLPYYGGEVFGLQAIGTESLRTGDPALLTLADTVRFGPVPASLFGAGVVLLAISGVLTALAVARSGRAPTWAGVPLAAALVLFLPQFFAAPALRIAHGVLLALGCLVLAWWIHRDPAVRSG